jgi:ferric-dicitrate binding protein FerR (iron transport regulator)
MSDSPDARRWRILELCERAIDGCLTAEEKTFLDQTLREDAELRVLFAKALHQHAELCFDPSLVKHLADDVIVAMPAPRRSWSVKPAMTALIAFAVMVMTLVGVGIFYSQSGVKTVASVTRSSQCKWAGSTLPTAEGSRVGIGTLELVEGLATLKFDSGAEVVMEAPATVEIMNAMACRLVRGTLVAEVPPSAKGFLVDTKDAKVIDYGTRFGVSTGEDGKYMVQVLEGHVEVNEKAAKESKQLYRGDRVDRGWTQSRVNPTSQEREPSRWQPDTIFNAGDGWQAISTAFGRGKDSYIQSSAKAHDFGHDPYFRVKRSDLQTDLNRKGYVCFDVSKFKGRTIEDAEFMLAIEPSDLGFATLVPDSSFAIYGLTDEAQDGWEEDALNWQSAPAHDPAQAERHLPLADKAKLLGHFQIPQGMNRGTRSIRSQALTDFLNADQNGLITLIICRETDETARGGLVHAFATKESGNNTPPMLRVKMR